MTASTTANNSKKLAFSPIKIDELRALGEGVLVSGMEFDQRTLKSGIVVASDNGKSSGIRPRWAQVLAVGPKQKDVLPGQWVCIAHGRWSKGIEIEDSRGRHTLRRVDPKDMLMVSDDKPDDETFGNL